LEARVSGILAYAKANHMRSSVLIADRYPVVLEGLRQVLGAQPDFRIVACCADGTSCLKTIRNSAPDIALVDASMPDIAGMDMLAIAVAEKLATRLVFFLPSIEDWDLKMLLAAGAYGVIPKEAAPEILLHALRRVARGQRLLPSVMSDHVGSREQAAIIEKPLTVLTDRERQIMGLVSEGLSNKEIGRRLNLTDGTIKVHLHNIFQKLEINNRTVLAALAISQNDVQ
jgi:two-component system, NarL family, nitrate/nitrite response regulator NarL